MRLSVVFAIAGVFGAAFLSCVLAAQFSVRVIEEASRHAVRDTLDAQGMVWTQIDADGLQVYLAGTAPSEAARFRALSVAGSVVESARIIDQMLVEESVPISPPRFSIEMLRNEAGLSLIGLVPADTDREALLKRIRAEVRNVDVTDFLETADYPTPATWGDALEFAVAALGDMPRTKISVEADRVSVVTMADSVQSKIDLETRLARRLPEDVRLTLDVSAPRPVATPFTLRYTLENGLGRFDACHADTEETRATILAAAGQAGLSGKPECRLALGVPSPTWGQATGLAIQALADLGGGTLTFTDADIALVALETTPQERFDTVIGRLETTLPEVYALKAVRPEPVSEDAPVAPEVVATLSPEGLVQIRGRVDSAVSRRTIDSFAQAKFASDTVSTAARVADDLPSDWTLRVLTGIEALAYLSNGAVTVAPDTVSVRGQTGRETASADISALFARKLGEAARFEIDVSYRETLDPVASLPTPEECEAKVAEVQVDRKITFEPGSSEIDTNGRAVMDDIAEILQKCGEIRMEIGGHTDSQGREVMNQQLSQSRAQTVLNELRARRVLTASITVRGYGESAPIADNDTEKGREANRRIEFKVIRPEPIVEEQTTLEALETETDADATPGLEDAEDPAETEGSASDE
ncbi:MAG: OmpA family protein [Pseudomonadota bacterium]